jgi:hypothetical protein
MDMVLGVVLVIVGGLVMGAGAWPMKLMRTFRFEHWWFLSIFFGLFFFPWLFTFIFYPNVVEIFRDPTIYKDLAFASALALCWGVANLLCGMCYVRIGIALTQAILSGLGATVAVLLPMIIKAPGILGNSPDLNSYAGRIILCGVAVLLVAVILASIAGFGRDKVQKKLQATSGNFTVGFIMVIIAGITSAGLWLAFSFGENAVLSRITIVEAGKTFDVGVGKDVRLLEKYSIKEAASGKIEDAELLAQPAVEKGDKDAQDALAKKISKKLSHKYVVAEDGTIAIPGVQPVKIAGQTAKKAVETIAAAMNLSEDTAKELKNPVSLRTLDTFAAFPVWAIVACSGALLNLIYPMIIMTKNKSWGVLFCHWGEFGLTLIMGIQTVIALTLPGKGILLMGALGASIGNGIQQAMQMAGGQGTGFISGEWRGVHGKPRIQLYISIALLLLASFIMIYSKTLE